MKKKAFLKFGNGKGMKKSIPIIQERESGAFILGNANGREREFPLTPAVDVYQTICVLVHCARPGVSGNSRSRPFPRMKASDSLSRIIGMDFFIPFPFPNFGNVFFSFPLSFLNFGIGIIHSCSRSRTPKSHSRSSLIACHAFCKLTNNSLL